MPTFDNPRPIIAPEQDDRSWHYFAHRLNGDGTETLLANELPLSGVSFTHALSAPNAMQASIPTEVLRLRTSAGERVFQRWSTAIYAEKDGLLRFGGILTDVSEDDQGISLDIGGFASYPYGQPYEGEQRWQTVDPLVATRHIWEHLQSFDGGNLSVVLDETTSPVRIGQIAEDDEPFLLAFFATHDLGGVIDDLAELCPFDYAEVTEWQGDTIRHRIRLGYPALGRARDDLRFVVGENIFTVPSVTQRGDDYASDVLFLGAGDGRSMIRGRAEVNERDGLRRVAVVSDRSVTTRARANTFASTELRARVGAQNVDSLIVHDHPSAPIHAISPGDEILVQGAASGWAGDFYLWVRVLEIQTVPDAETATLRVTRSERTTPA